MIYLDNAATTKVSDEVLTAMMPYFTKQYGNPSSIHIAGQAASAAVERARSRIAKTINTNPENIIFTSGGTEANNLALLGVSNSLEKQGKRHIIATITEHKSVISCMKQLFYKGFEITWLTPNKEGEYSFADVVSAIRKDTGLITMMGVNNELGTRNDIHTVAAYCYINNILFHTDCVQAYGNIDIDTKVIKADFISVSGHKIHAPKGVGFLYARNKELLNPHMLGGSQEFGLRAGTENVPSIVGLGIAAESAYNNLQNGGNLHYQKLRQKFLSIIEKGLGEYGYYLNGNSWHCSKTLNMFLPDIDGETLLLLLSSKGVCVSAGSACNAHNAEPSYVLKGIGLSDKDARSSIRVSFSKDTTLDEVEEGARIIVESVKELRG